MARRGCYVCIDEKMLKEYETYSLLASIVIYHIYLLYCLDSYE